ncbi:hypothetical protein DDQ50_04640 [Amnibacterium flavum]|uniref:Uncharacterized protein n=2 Tax=Amnibacterium flavum TaxID=2173173 RepID=A0A2V1HWZ2_9MICO|nr:hypothetical protein DDQ50_04640 [Amnibacterium flavum]
MGVGEVVTLRPLFASVARRANLSALLALTPPFAALYFLTWASGGALVVLIVNAIVVAILVGGIARMAAVRVAFSQDEIVERGYLGGVHSTPAAELASVLVVPVNSGRSLATNTHVFFLDRDGRTRLRLRGQYWGDAMIARALDAYDLPIERLTEPITRSELRHRFGVNLYWYERHPALTYLIGGAAVLVITAPLIAALNSVI